VQTGDKTGGMVQTGPREFSKQPTKCTWRPKGKRDSEKPKEPAGAPLTRTEGQKERVRMGEFLGGLRRKHRQAQPQKNPQVWDHGRKKQKRGCTSRPKSRKNTTRRPNLLRPRNRAGGLKKRGIQLLKSNLGPLKRQSSRGFTGNQREGKTGGLQRKAKDFNFPETRGGMKSTLFFPRPKRFRGQQRQGGPKRG